VTRREAAGLLLLALGLVVAGVVWLFGPYGLVAAGVALGVLVLFVVDVNEVPREAVERPSGPRGRASIPR
jgi:hypothetical protein